MGWASGGEILESVADLVMPEIPARNRPRVAAELIEIFESSDCDVIDEVDNKDIRKAWKIICKERGCDL